MRIFLKILIVPFLIFTPLRGKDIEHNVPDYFGEKIVYTLKAGIFQIGVVEIEFLPDANGCGAYILCNARSTGVVNFLKDVHYKFDVCMDSSNGMAIKSSRYIKEGNYTDTDQVFYNRRHLSDSVLAITEDADSTVIGQDVHDILLAFFQFRKNYINASLQIDTTYQLKTFFVDEEWDLNIKYGGKEKIKTKLGEANCHKFLPETEVGRYFKTREDMRFWVTSNKYLIPLLIEVKMKIATFTAEIESYQRPYKFRQTLP